MRFRHRLEKHKLADAILASVNHLLSEQGLLLKEGSAVDATLIAAPSSTKNKSGKRDLEMHSRKKGNQRHFEMKAHIGVDADSGLVHTVRGTAGHMADVTEGSSLLHGEETAVFADAGYQGADKRPDANKTWPTVPAWPKTFDQTHGFGYRHQQPVWSATRQRGDCLQFCAAIHAAASVSGRRQCRGVGDAQENIAGGV